MTLRRAALAPPARTLVDIFDETVESYPDEPALDNGADVLTYAEFAAAAAEVASELADAGVGAGDRVGVRINSGTIDLYVAIMGILTAGAAYVPVDADDPDARARLVFREADVAAIVGNDLGIVLRRAAGLPAETADITTDLDAWIIFTSGSTGTPKGVAVRHRSAAAFVDAETRLFLQGEPIGPGIGSWRGSPSPSTPHVRRCGSPGRYGACLVPAPRSLVRTGMDLGPWLSAAASPSSPPCRPWPRCGRWMRWTSPPADLRRRGVPARTRGPSRRTGPRGVEHLRADGGDGGRVRGPALVGEPVRIGLPLDGWDLAVVDPAGQPVADGERAS